MNDSRNFIPMKEFVKLLKEANRAAKRKDQTTFDAISKRLETIGYRLIIKLDGVYVEMVNKS
jgi:ribosomal protein S4